MSVYVEALEAQVRAVLDSENLESLRPILADQYAADIADILERLDDEDKLKVFGLLEPELAAEVLDETGSEATRSLLRQLSAEQVGDLLDQMPMDDVLEILTEDVPERQEELLAAMEPEDAAEVRDLLQYPEHSAGRLMTQKFVRIPPASPSARRCSICAA
ncbi:MAG: magnesium transporter MgtE N-terminal domain-containing protein [Aggregatilineales bacterium]